MKTTVLVFHPNIAQSRVNSALAKGMENISGVEVRYMYDIYPDGKINVADEQTTLENSQRIVLQFPMQWYSTPPLLKQWLDDVLTYGWAYGSGGTALAGKELMLAVSLGGPESAYQTEGVIGHTVGEYLLSFETIAKYTSMQSGKSFITGDSPNLSDEDIAAQVVNYRSVLA